MSINNVEQGENIGERTATVRKQHDGEIGAMKGNVRGKAMNVLDEGTKQQLNDKVNTLTEDLRKYMFSYSSYRGIDIAKIILNRIGDYPEVIANTVAITKELVELKNQIKDAATNPALQEHLIKQFLTELQKELAEIFNKPKTKISGILMESLIKENFAGLDALISLIENLVNQIEDDQELLIKNTDQDESNNRVALNASITREKIMAMIALNNESDKLREDKAARNWLNLLAQNIEKILLDRYGVPKGEFARILGETKYRNIGSYHPYLKNKQVLDLYNYYEQKLQAQASR